MSPILAAAVGLIAGLHAATWGMYKDAPHEGFSLHKYARSPALGTALGIAVSLAAGLDPGRPASLVVLFGVVYAIERALVEIYKTFLRQEDQSKYFIPMQFHVLGRVVAQRGARWAVGALYAGVLLGLVVVVHRVERGAGPLPLAVVVAIGGIGGWISAFGGAWKDAPKEGFQWVKFLRSPLLATLYAAGLTRLSGSLLLVTLAALGYTVATTETYKTFFFPATPRGKFAGMPVHHPDMLRRRQRFIPLYVAIWLAVAAAIVLAVVDTERQGRLAAFLLLTLGCHGPLSPFLPATYEPILLHYGQLFPPASLALAGAVASAPAEYLNYHLYRAILRWETLDRVMRSRSALAVASLFERRPFLAIVACAASPLPDWAARALAAHAGYSVPRYLGAFVIGRLPKFWLIAAAGSYWMPGTVTILAIAGGAAAISIVGVLRRCLGPGSTPSSLRPLSSARG